MTEQDTIEMRRRVRAILNVLAFAHVRAEDIGASAEAIEDAPLEMALLDQLRQAVTERGCGAWERSVVLWLALALGCCGIGFVDCGWSLCCGDCDSCWGAGGKSPADTMRAVMPHIAHASLPVLVWIGEEWSEWQSKIQEYPATYPPHADRPCVPCLPPEAPNLSR